MSKYDLALKKCEVIAQRNKWKLEITYSPIEDDDSATAAFIRITPRGGHKKHIFTYAAANDTEALEGLIAAYNDWANRSAPE